MNSRDLVSSLFLLGTGGIFCWGGVKLKLFSKGTPAAGLFPFLVGFVLMILATIILISAIKKEKRSDINKSLFFPEKDSYRKVLYCLLALGGYQLLMTYLGFTITTFLFMIFLLRFIEPQKWSTILLTAFVTAASSYTLFTMLLKIRLPKGIFGF